MKNLTLLLSLILFSVSFNANAQDPYHFEFSQTIVFPNGQSNSVSYISLPNVVIGGNLTISLTGGYNFQLNKGLLSKRITIVDNGAGQFSNTSSEILFANGELARQWAIGDYDKATRRIPIYHLLTTGNDLNIKIEGQLMNSQSVTAIKNAVSISAPVASTTPQTRQYKSMMDDRIGIGTLNPQYKLDVIGSIRASEIRVDLNGADFVFEKDYPLMPLGELEKYVKERKHLPGVASAHEMEENGTELGNLNSKLLQKIEELTLHLIEKEKQIIDQQKQLNAQDLRTRKLEGQIKKLINK